MGINVQKPFKINPLNDLKWNQTRQSVLRRETDNTEILPAGGQRLLHQLHYFFTI